MRQVQVDEFEMMVASHNQASIEQATALMQELGIQPDSKQVHFGQLQGMADHLTYTLGAHGYQVSLCRTSQCIVIELSVCQVYQVNRGLAQCCILDFRKSDILLAPIKSEIYNQMCWQCWLQLLSATPTKHSCGTRQRGICALQAYKAVPCGPVEETIAYLVRRAKENSDVLGGVGKEIVMLKAELWRRLKNNNAVARWLQQEPVGAQYQAAG